MSNKNASHPFISFIILLRKIDRDPADCIDVVVVVGLVCVCFVDPWGFAVEPHTQGEIPDQVDLAPGAIEVAI